jgi:hypothetical protein
MLEINDISRTSGGTFANAEIVDRVSVSLVESGVKTVCGLKKRVESMANGRETTASASAKASECSKIVTDGKSHGSAEYIYFGTGVSYCPLLGPDGVPEEHMLRSRRID